MSESGTKPGTGARRPRLADRPPRHLYLTSLGLLAWMAVAWLVILGTTVQGVVVFVVCVVFSLVAFGISGITAGKAIAGRPGRWRHGDTDRRDPDRPDAGSPGTGSPDAGARRRLATESGSLPMTAAAVQILLIPGVLAVGFTVFALIDVLMRT